MNPTNEQELREQFVDAMWNYFGIEDKSELDHFRTIFDEVVNPLVTAHTNAAIAKVLDRLYGELMEEGETIVHQWQVEGAIAAERAKLKERDDE